MPDVQWLAANDGNYTEGGNSMEYIVVHNTGNTASAAQEASYAHNDQHNSSYHYVLDDDEIWQIVHEYDTAWSVGAWKGCTQYIGNRETINIEVCSNGDPFTDAEVENLRWLIADIRTRHDIDDDHIVRHYDCHSGHKDCPAAYVDDDAWAELKARITSQAPAPLPYPVQDNTGAENDCGIKYAVHVARAGWLDTVHDGQVAGTTGYSAQMEAIRIKSPLALKVSAHLQDTGWVDYGVITGKTVIGTTGESRRLEAIKIELVGNDCADRRLHYQVHVADIGWQDPVDGGQVAGTTGEAHALEAIKIWTTPAAIQADSKAVNNNGWRYQAHVQDLGWCSEVHDGQVAGTTGFLKRMEAIRFTAIPSGLRFGIKLHVQDLGWHDYGEVHVGDIIGTVGKGERIEAVLPYLIASNGKTPYFEVHGEEAGWEGKQGFDVSEGSTGLSKRLEAIKFWTE